jgi:hypothetical protein
MYAKIACMKEETRINKKGKKGKIRLLLGEFVKSVANTVGMLGDRANSVRGAVVAFASTGIPDCRWIPNRHWILRPSGPAI